MSDNQRTLERMIKNARLGYAGHSLYRSTDDEVRRILASAQDIAKLANVRVVPVAWKLRALGASDELIAELCND